MSELYDQETAESVPLSLATVVGRLEELSRDGDPLVYEHFSPYYDAEEGIYYMLPNGTVERRQNFESYGWEITVFVTKDIQGRILSAEATFVDENDNEGLDFEARSQSRTGWPSLVEISDYTEQERLDLIRLLEDAVLLDDLEWKDFEPEYSEYTDHTTSVN